MKTVAVFLSIMASQLVFGSSLDPTGYDGVRTISAESNLYIVNHYHNWSEETRSSRFDMISTDQNPFTSDNNYAYLEVIDKKTNEVVFKSPCTALTGLYISDCEGYVLGISNIMLWNPYQLIVFTIDGELLKKRNFTSQEAKLSKGEYESFTMNFPSQMKILKEYTYEAKSGTFIDFLRMGMPSQLGEAWDFLIKHVAPNHLTNNISETTTNYVFWFDENNPNITFERSDKELLSIGFNDPKGIAVCLPLLEQDDNNEGCNR